MKLTFWGTRGSLPVPGHSTLRHGGNCTCLELDLDGRLVIVDAGSGIKNLGAALDSSLTEVILLISHLHWDHILGFPFFAPVYWPGMRIRVGGWPKAEQGLAGLFGTSHLDGCFPVTFEELPSTIWQDPTLCPEGFSLNGVEVSTTHLNHPQGALGFRFQAPGGGMVFVTDNELPGRAGRFPESLTEFCRGARVLIHDAQYEPWEADMRRGWGHSDWRSALELARRAEVPRLVLTHHDPDRCDEDIERIVHEAQDEAGTLLEVQAAREGMVLTL